MLKLKSKTSDQRRKLKTKLITFSLNFSIQYQNEAGGDPPDKDDSDDSKKQQNAYSISTYATHHITMEGITFYTEEFRIYNDKKDVLSFILS